MSRWSDCAFLSEIVDHDEDSGRTLSLCLRASAAGEGFRRSSARTYCCNIGQCKFHIFIRSLPSPFCSFFPCFRNVGWILATLTDSESEDRVPVATKHSLKERKTTFITSSKTHHLEVLETDLNREGL